jgi:glycosyltransferase involved in cell wall biosynthesis
MDRTAQSRFDVSVVIPAYNAAGCLAGAVQSVLAQTFPASEVIVVNDGSGDGTASLARTFGAPVRCVDQPHAGLPAARNRGARESRCEWVAFLDADDRWRPEKLEAQAKAVTGNPDAGWVYTDAVVVDAQGLPLREWTFPFTDGTQADVLKALFLGHVVAGSASSVAVRRDCLVEVGMFDPEMKAVEDVDCWMRLAARYPLAHAPGFHVEITRQAGSLSSNVLLMRKHMHKVHWKNRHLLGRGLGARWCWNSTYAGRLLTTGKMCLTGGFSNQAVRDLLECALRSPWGYGRWGLAMLVESLLGRQPSYREKSASSCRTSNTNSGFAGGTARLVDSVSNPQRSIENAATDPLSDRRCSSTQGKPELRGGTGSGKVRVVYIEEGRGFGGAVAVLANVIPLLAKKGFESHVVLRFTDERAEGALRKVSRGVYVLPYRRRTRSQDQWLAALGRKSAALKLPCLLALTIRETLEQCFWVLKLACLLARIRPDIVHGNNGPGQNFCGLLLARAMGLPTVVSVRDAYERTIWARMAERFCDAEIFVSKHLRERMGSRNPHASVIYDGLPVDKWPVRSQDGDPITCVRVGHLGMFTPSKGQEVFLQAATRVAQQEPAVEFLLLGDVVDAECRSYRERLRSLAKGSGYGERICFRGFEPDVRRALVDLHVLVHSSVNVEAFGMVVLEGMAAGLAVIASNEGGPVEIIRHGVDGILVKPRCSEALAEAIRELLRDPVQIRTLGQAARQTVAERFPIENTAWRIAQVYRRLVGPKG